MNKSITKDYDRKQNPVVGVEEYYQINDIFPNAILGGNNVQYLWYLWRKRKNGSWFDITKNGQPKEGTRVPYKFGETFLGTEFKIQVYKVIKDTLTQKVDLKRLFGELIIVPTSSKTPSIEQVVLFNGGGSDVNKAHYTDTLIARAHCIAMFGQTVEFQLWEDDAAGGGHNAVANKNNKHSRAYQARVNEKGIAEAKIPLSADERILKAVANKYVKKDEKSEGSTHEYYVTASYHGKIQGSSQKNVNVANTTGNSEQPKPPQQAPAQTPATPAPAPANPSRSQPSQNTPTFPATGTSAAPRRPDPQGKILDAYFVNSAGQRLTKVVEGDTVIVYISTKNMIGKHIQYIIWEYDGLYNDEIYSSVRIKLNSDVGYAPPITITSTLFKKGIDLGPFDPDSDNQNYFIEVLPLDVSAESKKFGVNSEGLMKVESAKSAAMVKGDKNSATNCGEKYCIKKGSPKSELIREINIRLAGFGGNVPTDEFTDRTEKMVKQFQRDYMKVPETGKVCGNVLKAIDDFQLKYPINFEQIKCKCGSCSGYGKERNSEQYQNTSVQEKFRKYEYPGVHRNLVCAYRASIFYIDRDKHLNYKTKHVESGYRCHDHYIYKRDGTTNHCGKALDIHYNILSTSKRTKSNADMNKIRKEIFMKYTGAKQDWNSGKDIFYLESFATTWIHVDVREFSQEYLTKKYFVKNSEELNGKSIVQLANELGFKDMCLCGGAFSSNQKENKNEKNKYKWAHSEFGNILAKEESGDDYNICNKTKGGLQIIRNLKITELTIKEIQQKQKDRDIFAVGRYQLIPDTFNGAISSLGLDLNEKLDEEMQDKIFDEYLIKVKRPKIIAYLEGDGTVEDAMYSSAQEWASVGVEKGKRISDKVTKDKNGNVISRIVRYAQGGESYYDKDGLNKSHITPEQIKNALINSKDANK